MITVSMEEATAQLPDLAKRVIGGETVLLSTSAGDVVLVSKVRYGNGVDDYDEDEIAFQNAVCATVEPRVEM